MSSEVENGQDQPGRRALIIDKNEEFSRLLERALGAVQVEAEVVETGNEGLARIAEQRPDVVFLSVEQPKKSGFEMFTRIKGVAKQVPIVISSSTVPMDDLLLHQKLRLHAEAYLDKRDLEEVELLKTLNGLLELGLDAAEIAEAALEMTSDFKRSPSADQDATGSTATVPAQEELEEEISTAIDALGVSIDRTLDVAERGSTAGPQISESSPPPEPAGSGETSRLQEELRDLRSKLNAVQHAASSSPFSAEFLELRKKADDGDRRIARLRAEIKTLSGQLVESEAGHAELTRRLRAAARKLVIAGKHGQTAADRAAELEQRLEAVQPELERAQQRIVGLERELTAQRDGVEKLKRASEDRIEELTRGHARDLAVLKDEHEAAIEELRREHESTTSTVREKLAEQERQAVAEEAKRLKAVHDEQLEELRREHESTTSTLCEKLAEQERQAVAEEAKRLKAVHDEQLERALARTEAEHRQQIERGEEEHRFQLDCAERKRRSDLVEAEAGHRAELGDAERKWRSELDETESRHRAELADAERKWRSALDEAETRHSEQLEAANQRYRARIEWLEEKRRVAEAAVRTHAAEAAQACNELVRLKPEAQGFQDRLRRKVANVDAAHVGESARDGEHATTDPASNAEGPEGAPKTVPGEPDDSKLFNALLESVEGPDVLIDLDPPAKDS